MYLNDTGIDQTPNVMLAAAQGQADASAGRPVSKAFADDAGVMYRHAYAMTAFHLAKAELLSNAVVFH